MSEMVKNYNHIQNPESKMSEMVSSLENRPISLKPGRKASQQ